MVNDDQFMEILKLASPPLYQIQKMMNDQHVFADEIMEICYKVGLVKGLDDGYGKIVAETKPVPDPVTKDLIRRVWRVRIIQDKVFKDDSEV